MAQEDRRATLAMTRAAGTECHVLTRVKRGKLLQKFVLSIVWGRTMCAPIFLFVLFVSFVVKTVSYQPLRSNRLRGFRCEAARGSARRQYVCRVREARSRRANDGRTPRLLARSALARPCASQMGSISRYAAMAQRPQILGSPVSHAAPRTFSGYASKGDTETNNGQTPCLLARSALARPCAS